MFRAVVVAGPVLVKWVYSKKKITHSKKPGLCLLSV